MKLAKRLITERFIEKYVSDYCEEKKVYPSFTLYKMPSCEVRHWCTGSITFKGNSCDYEIIYKAMVAVNRNHRLTAEAPF